MVVKVLEQKGGLLDILYHNKKVFILILKKEKVSNPAHQLIRASTVTIK